MRAIWCTLWLLAIAGGVHAQEGEQAPEKEPAPGEKKADPKAPKEPPVWKLPERDRDKLAKLVEGYLYPGRKSRQDHLAAIEKYLAKPIDGHSALEDVAAIASIVNASRAFNPKIGRKGKITTVEVRPEVHGFPPGIGTVKYELYLPRNYAPRKRLSPLIFCLPDNKRWQKGSEYITSVWTKRSEVVGDEYVIVVPHPQAKADPWTREKSYARAMITLRHVLGTFDATKKTGGPAIDLFRVFIDGEDVAATVAARFAEMFAGAILRGSDGKASGGPALRGAGISGLPTYCIHNAKKSYQRKFAAKLKADNDATVVVAAAADDADMLGDAEKAAAWLKTLPPRGQPRTIEYLVHDASFQRHFWINVLEFDGTVKPAASFLAVADRARNVVRVESSGLTRFELFLNDALVDLSPKRKVKIVVVEGDTELVAFHDVVTRDVAVMLGELVASNHAGRVYPVRFVIDVPLLRARAEDEAAKKAKEAAEGSGAEGAKGSGAGDSQKKSDDSAAVGG